MAPPAPIPSDMLTPMARRGLGRKGNRIPLLTNHLKVTMNKAADEYFYHYNVSIFYDDGQPALVRKDVCRKIVDQLHKIYSIDHLAGKQFAYDGNQSLFTLGPLPQNVFEFNIILVDPTSSRNNINYATPEGHGSPNESDKKRMKRPSNIKGFKVVIKYVSKIPMSSITKAIRGKESKYSQEALRVLDIILGQHAAKRGCLLVRQSFFHNDVKTFVDVGGGVLGCQGFHSSFRTTQSQLSLNIDVTTTMIVKPGPVIDFLVANQNARDYFSIDWKKAKHTLKNLRVTVSPTNQDYKIIGLSEKTCREQTFKLKRENKDGEFETTEMTVYDYFVNIRKIKLRFSADLPCINVGRPKRPTYFPVELCSLVSLQRYTKALSTLQRSSLVEKSRQKPRERMSILSSALEMNNYNAEPLLQSCGISISNCFTQVQGRVLSPPKIKVGNGEDVFTRNGRWNCNNKKFFNAVNIANWIVVNFSARCHIDQLIKDFKKVGGWKGIRVDEPLFVFNENSQFQQAPPLVRVDKMCEVMKSKLPARDNRPNFILCLLPEKKNSELYGPWKRKNLLQFGVVTQCMSPPPRGVNDNYLMSIMMKINAKLGGLSSMLDAEVSRSIPMVSRVPTIILGMDISHGSSSYSDVPSVAAVVSSRKWPSISCYRACVQTQAPKQDMIDFLYKPEKNAEGETVDNKGIMRELLSDFYSSSGHRKPDHIIIFRYGVNENQFSHLLNIELSQIRKACKSMDDKYNPKFVVIVAQKNHHTRFFQPNSSDNVPAGTVVDNTICHPRNYDFYMCAHAGLMGTTRPTHYHVLLDEVGFSEDDLQELVHSLSYVYQRSNTAISVVAPIYYANLAAAQCRQWMKLEDMSEMSSTHEDTAPGASAPAVPPIPKLHKDVRNSMFFC